MAPPELNFDLGGVANLLDFPGLVEVAKSAAMEFLSPMVVVPCGIVVPMVEQDSEMEQVDLIKLCIRAYSTYILQILLWTANQYSTINFRTQMLDSRTSSCSKSWWSARRI